MRRIVWLISLFVIAATGFIPSGAMAQSNRLCFNIPRIAHCIEGRFREYWEQNGGLAVFGYPLSTATQEPNRDTGRTYLTQWFERNRFELHPENPRPYDVLLGRLGDDRLRQQGRDWQTWPNASPSALNYFPQTGHAITYEAFWIYWSSHGLEFDGRFGKSTAESLALFGYPLGEPAMEQNLSGDTVLTQWFERARLEWHPANPEGYRVLLGLLGAEIQQIQQPIEADCLPIVPELSQHYTEGRTPGGAVYNDFLGCPTAYAQASAAEQIFEQGRMLWHQSFYPRTPGTIYVAYQTSYPARYERYPDRWQEGQPETAGLAPPPGRLEPKRGFGQVWREQPGVRERLGWATHAERSEAALIATFEHGTMIWLQVTDVVYIFVNNSDLTTIGSRLK